MKIVEGGSRESDKKKKNHCEGEEGERVGEINVGDNEDRKRKVRAIK